MSDLSTVTVIGLQGRDVSSAAPSDGDLLAWDATTSEWKPVNPPEPALQSWVGSVNTQAQVIQRIPFTYRLVGTGSTVFASTVSFTPPSNSVSAVFFYVSARPASSPAWCTSRAEMITVLNNGGTITIQASNTSVMAAANIGSLPASISYDLSNSSGVVTLRAFSGLPNGVTVDGQGYVDLIIT